LASDGTYTLLRHEYNRIGHLKNWPEPVALTSFFVELPGIEPDELSHNIGPELPTTPNARPARHVTGQLAKRPPGTISIASRHRSDRCR
jgi:hypothetical protein